MVPKAFPLEYNNHNYLYQMVMNANKITNTTKEVTAVTADSLITDEDSKDSTNSMLFALVFMVFLLLAVVYLLYAEKTGISTRSERTRLLRKHKTMLRVPLLRRY